jgi:hypothetical protein
MLVHYTALVARTARIALGEVVRIDSGPAGAVDYTFTTLETLKGPAEQQFIQRVAKPSSDRTEYDFDHHRDADFWGRDGRTVNDADCEIYPSFELGGRYLIFRDPPYHWKSFERIIYEDDRWLAVIRLVVRK